MQFVRLIHCFSQFHQHYSQIISRVHAPEAAASDAYDDDDHKEEEEDFVCILDHTLIYPLIASDHDAFEIFIRDYWTCTTSTVDDGLMHSYPNHVRGKRRRTPP